MRLQLPRYSLASPCPEGGWALRQVEIKPVQRMRRPLKDWWSMEKPPVLPGAGLLPLTFEQSTILAQVEEARWGPTLRSKSTSSSLIRIGQFSILAKKVGKVLILEKRKIGKLEFR